MKRLIIVALMIFLSLSDALMAEGRSGKDVYDKYCTACHTIGVANAPKLNDSAAWKARKKTWKSLWRPLKKA